MNQPLIAIIVPVYKVEQYLRRCLDSILAQTYKNFEVILVDDGSPDQCGEICDEYARKDARFTVIHQENKGLSGARNSGIEKCLSEKKAQYIFFVDSDDYIAKNALELLVKETRDCNFDIIMGGYSEVWQDNTVQYSSLNWQKKADVQEICMDILCNNLPNFAWGKLYKTILWEKIRFPDGVNMEDMYTIPKVFYKARSAVSYTHLRAHETL